MRAYSDLVIQAYLRGLAKRGAGESESAYLERATAAFKQAHPHMLVADLSYFRQLLSGHGPGPVKMPAVLTKQLDPNFNAHVLGNDAGVGWHSETVHANGNPGYSYSNRRVLAASKGTYKAETVTIAGTLKSGNDGVSAFFPAGMTIAEIREEALYVANTNKPTAANNQTITGLGRRTGILIDCLMNGSIVISAYPHI